jgi:signal transduction histidine kinase
MEPAGTRAARAVWPLALAGVALGLATLLVAADARWFRPDDGWAWAQALGLAAGWALIGCGVYAWRRRPGNRTGPLVMAAGFAWFAPSLIGWAAGPALLFTAALLAAGLYFPLAVHAALASPTGRLAGRPECAAVTLAYGGAALWCARALFLDPVDGGCFGCARNLVGVLRDRETAAALADWSAWAGIAAAVAIATVVGVRLARVSRAARALAAPTLGAGVALAGAHAVASIAVIRSDIEVFGTGGPYVTRAVCALLLAGALGWGFVRAGRARQAVADLVAELADGPRPGTLRDVLARLLGDPTVALAYWLPERGHYVDAEGGRVELPAADSNRVAVEIRRGRELVAVLTHERSRYTEPGLRDEILVTARLALEHERLRAAIGAQQRDVHASRARIVAVGDAARRQLERDLHDGAQQRLLSLGLALQLARGQVPPGGEADTLLRDAGDLLQAAHAELREIAHGIHPAILSEEGLPAALRTLRERAPLEVIMRSVPAERLPEAIEVTAYLLAAEAVAAAAEEAAPAALGVAVARREDRVIVELDGVAAGTGAAGWELGALEDRVAALDGRLAIDEPGRIHAELPITGAVP